MQHDKEAQLEYNLGVLKRRDAAITNLVDMAGHVVLYQFNEDSQAWDRRNVEGALFVVERSGDPTYQFIVLNRLSSENLVESITADFQTELTDQFLLYRNLNAEILGIWFYSAPERSAISNLLNSLAEKVAAAPTPAAEPQAEPPASGTDAGSTVASFFSMMSSKVPPDAAPPMPQGAANPAPSTAPAPAPGPAPSAGGPARAPPDMDALKARLSSQLRSLLDDDAFLSLLATEYVKQQQRAIAQAQQQRQARAKEAAKGGGAPPGAQAAAAGGNGGGKGGGALPAHLASLLQQQNSG